MDVDNSVATGFSMKEMGVDYGCEGNLWDGGWFAPSIVDMVNGDPGWPFMGFDNEKAIKPGYIVKEDNTIKMEFGISREVFKINSRFHVIFHEYYEFRLVRCRQSGNTIARLQRENSCNDEQEQQIAD